MYKRIDTFVKLLRLSKMALLLTDIYWAKKLIAHSISSEDVRCDRKSGSLLLKKLNIRISKGQNLFLLKGYHYAVLLADSLGAQFHLNEQNEVFVDVTSLKVHIQSSGELYILKALLVDGVYNMQFSGPVIVWDIGMHVGLASLYFASKPDVVVVGFEPFKETFNQALRNISLNPMLSDRIRAFNVGLSDSAGKVCAEYNREIADHLGVYSPRKDYKEGLRFEREEIVLRDARQALDSIVADYPGRAIVAKIDCEGSEYRIISALAAAGKLRLLEAIMMEWHIRKLEHDPATLTSLLCDAGFRIFLFQPHSRIGGMLYAVRGNRRP